MFVKICAVNSKFLHSNPAVYSLFCYYKSLCEAAGIRCADIEVSEYTVNDTYKTALLSVLSGNPHVIAFSVYIWNVEFISKLCGDIKKISPNTKIILGGPEVSYGVPFNDNIYDYIIAGEGERAFFCLVNNINNIDISGYIKKFGLKISACGKIFTCDEIENLSEIPFIYSRLDIEIFRNRIIYYESSRGCPFSCAYCLSACGRGVRCLPLERVFADIDFFLREKKEEGGDSTIKQIKFVDRTFNCDKNRAYSIFKYIIDNAAGIDDINFHFEICADLLDNRLINLLRNAKPGLIQFEIGIQTTNQKSLELCSRKTDIDKCFENINALLKNKNINIHVDLIAGLPEDDYKSFQESFNRVYLLHSHQFQLGFLKLLRGAPLNSQTDRYGYIFSSHPPYEILSSNSMTAKDLADLNGVETILDKLYNSGRFVETLKYLTSFFETPFEFYLQISRHLSQRDLLYCQLSLENLYAAILGFALFSHINIEIERLKETLLLDYHQNDAYDKPPKVIKDIWQPYKTYSKMHKSDSLFLTLRKVGENLYWFDYAKRNPVTGKYDYRIYRHD